MLLLVHLQLALDRYLGETFCQVGQLLQQIGQLISTSRLLGALLVADEAREQRHRLA